MNFNQEDDYVVLTKNLTLSKPFQPVPYEILTAVLLIIIVSIDHNLYA